MGTGYSGLASWAAQAAIPRDVRRLDAGQARGDLHPLLQAANHLNEFSGALAGRVRGRGDAGKDGQLAQLLVDNRAIRLQHDGQQHRVGQTVGDVVLSANGVGHGVHIADVRLGEGDARLVGGYQHIGAGGAVGSVPIGLFDVVYDELHRILGQRAGFPVGAVADVRLHGVGQRVHAGRRRQGGRQGEGDLGIQHRSRRE